MFFMITTIPHSLFNPLHPGFPSRTQPKLLFLRAPITFTLSNPFFFNYHLNLLVGFDWWLSCSVNRSLVWLWHWTWLSSSACDFSYLGIFYFYCSTYLLSVEVTQFLISEVSSFNIRSKLSVSAIPMALNATFTPRHFLPSAQTRSIQSLAYKIIFNIPTWISHRYLELHMF